MKTKKFIIVAGLVMSSVTTFASNAFNVESKTYDVKRIDAVCIDQQDVTDDTDTKKCQDLDTDVIRRRILFPIPF